MAEPSPPDASAPGAVLARWKALSGQPSSRIAVGNINHTFRVEGRDGPVILQKVHPVFGPEVHEDIDTVTRHVEAQGLVTPRLLVTDDGALCMTDDEGAVWRAMTFIEGTCVEKVTSPAMAEAAGELAGRFHLATSSLEHTYHFTRAGVHDTPGHLGRLAEAVDPQGAHTGHRLYGEVKKVADEVMLGALSVPDFSSLPLRHSHGDLKISNLMFDEQGVGRCVIDLDTLALMVWPFEMGDALRSWCNPRMEDERPVAFEAELFEAAMRGYARAAPDLVTDDELELLVAGAHTICLELSARFLDDALREQYFGFDAKRYPGPGEHHLARGLAMAELAASVDAQRTELEQTLRRLFRSP